MRGAEFGKTTHTDAAPAAVDGVLADSSRAPAGAD